MATQQLSAAALLKNQGHSVFNPKLPDDDFAAALAIAQAEFD